MDRSFLSDTRVVEASRKFVCVRLATYEDKKEAEFLKTIFLGRTGELENSVFALLAPDGKKRLSRTGRSPRFAFSDAAEMAAAMQKISKKYQGKKIEASTKSKLPYIKNLRLALNVASADAQQLLIVYAKDAKQKKQMETELRKVLWGKALIGRFLLVSVTGKDQLKGIEKAPKQAGQFILVTPGAYGLSAEIKAKASAAAKAKNLEKILQAAVKKHKATSKDSRSHIRKGRRNGVKWETEVPVTDPHERRARRGR